MSSWQANAVAWAARVRAGDPHREGLLDGAVLAALQPVRGASVLDVGCGEGRFTRFLARAGAGLVVGVDVSSRLVGEARRATARLPAALRARVRYRTGDATRLPQLRGGSFDAVLSYLSLMHFSAPGRALGEWARVLGPGGRLVVVIPHPFTQAPGARWEAELPPVMAGVAPRLRELVAGRYFGHRRIRFRFGPEFPAETWNVHRPLSAWSGLFARAGLLVERLWEPRPTAAQVRRDPEWEPYRRQPYFLVLRAVRAGRAGGRGAGGRLPGHGGLW